MMPLVSMLLAATPFLGLTTDSWARDAGDGSTCAEVSEVVDGGPAAGAGVRRGDCIRAVSVANQRFASFCQAAVVASVGTTSVLELEDGGAAAVRWGDCSQHDYPVLKIEVGERVRTTSVSSLSEVGTIVGNSTRDGCSVTTAGPCGRAASMPPLNAALNSECITRVTITCPTAPGPAFKGDVVFLRFPSGVVQELLLSDGDEPPEQLRCKRSYPSSRREYFCAGANARRRR